MSDESSEQDRVDAENLRVAAEEGRVARSEERVIGEEHRVSAEKMREHAQRTYESELAALQEDPDHYMTPGARKYFRRVSIGYVILAVGCIMGIWSITNRADNQIRHDINAVAKAQCLGSIPTLQNYNSLVDIQIESNRGSRAIALKEGDTARVKLTTANIVKLQKAHIRIPNAKECDAPILK